MQQMLLDTPTTAATVPAVVPTAAADVRPARLWTPKRVVFTPAALDEPWGQQIYTCVQQLGLPIEELPTNRVTGVRGADERATYSTAKRTLAVATAPAGQFKLQPIPPSADWQFHLAEGCPAHCQYCYLAGSLSGPPMVRVFANLPQILDNLARYERPGQMTTFEASCYTDPLGIEHLTGSLAETIRYFGTRKDGHLRYVSKFDAVDHLLDLPHNGQTRARFSVNAAPVSQRLEGGTASVAARLQAARKMAQAGYPIGLVVAPIMPIPDWEEHYTRFFELAEQTLADVPCDLTFELITHRFTPGSKEILMQWYPNTSLDMDETTRTTKRNKYGSIKYVYSKEMMKTLQRFFNREIAGRFGQAQVLYWT